MTNKKQTKTQRVLQNIALYDLNKFCIENKIDCAGTHVVKQYPRQYMYSLCSDKTGKTILTITYSESQAPYYFIQPNN